MLSDLRVTVRALAAKPAFVVLVVIILALSLGAATAVFSVVIAGAAAGTLAAAGAAPIVRRLLFGIGPFDPAVYVGIPVLLIVISMLACWWPARSAARVAVIDALRNE